MLWFCR